VCAHTSIGATGSSRRRSGARQVERGESRISIDRIDLEDDLGVARAGDPVGLGGRHIGIRGERTISSAAGCRLRSETAARDRVGHAEAAAETRRHALEFAPLGRPLGDQFPQRLPTCPIHDDHRAYGAGVPRGESRALFDRTNASTAIHEVQLRTGVNRENRSFPMAQCLLDSMAS
jgi:hypothetical protein